jgi:3-phosphoshikimate 1-carboxyvinyltransferase
VALLELLRTMGAAVTQDADGIVVRGSALRGCAFDVAGAIDLLPVACALGAAASGDTILSGIARAREKESDRVASMADGLARLGVRVDVDSDRMVIHGGVAHGGEVSSAGDHRIAMAFGVLGSLVGDVVVHGAECVSKTYPGFWETIESLGVKVVLDE